MFLFKKNSIKFSQEVWMLERDNRLKIVDDLINTRILINLNKQEVKIFLGDEFNDVNSKVWSYYLGSCLKVLSFKKYMLYIYFNELNKVSRVIKK